MTPGPPLRTGPAREAQLRDIIAGHGGDLRGCVERQLKLDPSLRADGLLVLEVEASGRVFNAEVKGASLAGTPLESCLRTVAMRWGFPRHAGPYAVEAPLKVSGVDGPPR